MLDLVRIAATMDIMLVRVIVVCIIVAVGIGCVFFFSMRSIGNRVDDPGRKIELKDLLAAENDMRATIFQFITVLALVAGAAITICQVIDTAKTTRAQLRLTQDSLLSQQFTQAVGQLATADKQTQLGGVYGLVTVASEQSSYAPVVINVLATFVRNAAGTANASTVETVSLRIREPGVQAALDALLRPPLSRERGSVILPLSIGLDSSVNLKNADFTGDDLTRIDLQNVALDGSNFTNATLTAGCFQYASFNRATFGKARLYGADFSHTNLMQALMPKTKKRVQPAYYDSRTKWPAGFTGTYRGFGKLNRPTDAPTAKC